MKTNRGNFRVSLLVFLILSSAPLLSRAQCPTFTSDQQLSFSAMFMTSGDIDGDGYIDFVSTTENVSDTARGGLYISFGDSVGFGTPIRLANIRVAPLVFAYIDTDTLLDIVAPSGFTIGGIFLNNGNRTFTRIAFPDSIPTNETKIAAAGYFNNDAYTDLIVGIWDVPGQVKLYLGNGTGGFGAGEFLNYGGGSLMVADFNGDNRDDYVCVTRPDTARIFIKLSGNGFSPGTAFRCPGNTLGVTLGKGASDFNNDGHVDFAFVGFRNPQRSVVTIVLGDGAGNALSVDTFNVVGYHWMIDAGDLNGDNTIDVFSAGASNVGSSGPHIAAFLSDGSGGFDTCTIPHPGQLASPSMSSGDIDRDGDLDILVGTEFFGVGPLTILYNDYSSMLTTGNSLTLTGFNGGIGGKREAQSNSSAVQVEIVNPVGSRFSRTVPGIAGASYWRLDADHNGTIDEKVIDNSLLSGNYTVIAREISTGSNIFSLVARIAGKPDVVLALNYDGFSGGAANDSIVLHFSNTFTSSVLPRNGIATGTAQPTFSWPSVSGATVYQFQLDRYHDFRTPLYDNNALTQPSFIPASSLNDESVYYWRYRSFDCMQWSEYSSTNAAYVSVCCIGSRGNVDGSANESPTIADLIYLVGFLFNNGPFPNCEVEADINASGNLTVADLNRLVSYLFASGSAPASCPAN